MLSIHTASEHTHTHIRVRTSSAIRQRGKKERSNFNQTKCFRVHALARSVAPTRVYWDWFWQSVRIVGRAYVYYVSIVSEKFELKCFGRIDTNEVEIAVSNCTIAIWKSTLTDKEADLSHTHTHANLQRKKEKWSDTKAYETTTIQNGISSRCFRKRKIESVKLQRSPHR